MRDKFEYAVKFESFRKRTLYELLQESDQDFIRSIAFGHRLTFQEFRYIVESGRDLAMWDEGTLKDWWALQQAGARTRKSASKKALLEKLKDHMKELANRPKRYRRNGGGALIRRERKPVARKRSEKKVFGMCPVASERTVCCNLRTIDAVENCVFGCSYCSVQTFYQDEIVVDSGLGEKLDAIRLDRNRFYHFGSGQSSDSLAWGNRYGILDALCTFARANPNVLLEFKTKSNNIAFFLENDLPRNVVCSWSLNTPVIIDNEEHFTARLEERIDAARRVADKGTRVAFHFHPMVYYDGWDVDYPDVAATLQDRFRADEVLFVSYGSVTLIKPVIKKIRELGNPSKILQMDLVPDPHGKLTYRDDVKVLMFRKVYEALEQWHGAVFMYLCMEKPTIWRRSLGYVYDSNRDFEEDFGRKTMTKL